MKSDYQVKKDLIALLGKLGLKMAQAVFDDMCAQFGDSDGDLIISSQIVSFRRGV